MDQKKSRTIWGINAFAVLGLGAFVVTVISFFGYVIYKDITRKRHVSSVVNVDPSAPIEAKWWLGEFKQITNTKYFISALSSEQSYEMSYYEKDASAVRNYMFVDSTDKSARWLVPTNSYLFLGAEQLHEKQMLPGEASTHKYGGTVKPPEQSTVKWLRYLVVTEDTNGDQRLTPKDQRVVAISSVSGEGYTELIRNIDAVTGSTLRDENTLILFYESGKKYFVAEINLPQHRVV